MAKPVTLLPPEAHEQAETVLLSAATRGATPLDVRALLGQTRHRIDPDTTTEAALAPDNAQHLHITEFGDGSYAVRGLLDPVSGASVLATLLPHADPRGAEDPRSPARRLADALVHVCDSHLEDPLRAHPGAPKSS